MTTKRTTPVLIVLGFMGLAFAVTIKIGTTFPHVRFQPPSTAHAISGGTCASPAVLSSTPSGSTSIDSVLSQQITITNCFTTAPINIATMSWVAPITGQVSFGIAESSVIFDYMWAVANSCGGGAFHCGWNQDGLTFSVTQGSTYYVHVDPPSNTVPFTLQWCYTGSGEFHCTAVTCGDGFVAGSEECDDDDTENGDGCSSTCTVEPGWQCSGSPSTCNTNCGNDVVEDDEECDGSDLNGQDCTDLGYDDGTLACSGACEFDDSNCSTCGNDSAEGDEECDGADLNSESCSTQGYDGGTLSCTGSCEIDNSSCTTCGDGTAEGDEECDGADLNSESCSTQGYDGGTLSCTGSCEIDNSSCTTCGDSVVEGDEECEASDINGTCSQYLCGGQACTGGALACDSCEHNTDACRRCGDGEVAGPEQCDDGNAVSGDGCGNCAVEGGYSCTGEPSRCGPDASGPGPGAQAGSGERSSCRSDSDCTGNPVYKYCDLSQAITGQGKCVECHTYGKVNHCAGNPRGELCLDNRCSACQSNRDCTDPKALLCDNVTNQCVQCFGTGTQQACAYRNNMPICNNNKCVQCASDRDCTGNGTCDSYSGTCTLRTCASDTDCAINQTRKVCDRSGLFSRCVECLLDEDCTYDPTKPVCYIFSCIPRPKVVPDIPCTADAQCPKGPEGSVSVCENNVCTYRMNFKPPEIRYCSMCAAGGTCPTGQTCVQNCCEKQEELLMDYYLSPLQTTGCGNGKVEEGEECDDGNQSSTDFCSYPDCKVQGHCCYTGMQACSPLNRFFPCPQGNAFPASSKALCDSICMNRLPAGAFSGFQQPQTGQQQTQQPTSGLLEPFSGFRQPQYVPQGVMNYPAGAVVYHLSRPLTIPGYRPISAIAYVAPQQIIFYTTVAPPPAPAPRPAVSGQPTPPPAPIPSYSTTRVNLPYTPVSVASSPSTTITYAARPQGGIDIITAAGAVQTTVQTPRPTGPLAVAPQSGNIYQPAAGQVTVINPQTQQTTAITLTQPLQSQLTAGSTGMFGIVDNQITRLSYTTNTATPITSTLPVRGPVVAAQQNVYAPAPSAIIVASEQGNRTTEVPLPAPVRGDLVAAPTVVAAEIAGNTIATLSYQSNIVKTFPLEGPPQIPISASPEGPLLTAIITPAAEPKIAIIDPNDNKPVYVDLTPAQLPTAAITYTADGTAYWPTRTGIAAMDPVTYTISTETTPLPPPPAPLPLLPDDSVLVSSTTSATSYDLRTPGEETVEPLKAAAPAYETTTTATGPQQVWGIVGTVIKSEVQIWRQLPALRLMPVVDQSTTVSPTFVAPETQKTEVPTEQFPVTTDVPKRDQEDVPPPLDFKKSMEGLLRILQLDLPEQSAADQKLRKFEQLPPEGIPTFDQTFPVTAPDRTEFQEQE